MLIPVEEALALALADLKPLPPERISLWSADGRVLAEDIVARSPLPPFDHSAMDGYAVQSGALLGEGPHELRVIGESRAGAGGVEVGPTTCCRIFTGAVLPEGADAVIIQENVTREGDVIRFDERPDPGQNVRREGSDLAAGTVALTAGERLDAGRLGLIAALDRVEAVVARRPVVTFLSTGDELRTPGQPGRRESIPESNGLVLSALARRAGAIPRVAPFVRDARAATEAAIRAAAAGSDLLVTVGGASVGDHDLVRPAMEAVGVTIDFWGVALKPGKPTASGRLGTTRVLGLPGNPGSATLTFCLFGMAILRTLQGDRAPRPRPTRMPVRGGLRRRPGREEYLRATLELEAEGWVARLHRGQSSGAVTSFARADALVRVPADQAEVVDGASLDVFRLADF
ncbi:MAG: molybdopterin molybdotransferase MoeA [Polyangiaceae bacterium]